MSFERLKSESDLCAERFQGFTTDLSKCKNHVTKICKKITFTGCFNERFSTSSTKFHQTNKNNRVNILIVSCYVITFGKSEKQELIG